MSPVRRFMSGVWLGRYRGRYSSQTVAASSRLAMTVAQTLGVLSIPATLALVVLTHNLYVGPVVPTPIFVFWVFTCAFSSYVAPRMVLLSRCQNLQEKPLTATEVATLLPEANDDLERAYLTLVLDVVRGDVEQGPGGDLRQALRALGDAIDKLPATRATGADSADIMTEVLRRTAEETLKRAQQESDRVVAASFIRRAEALHRRADATTRSHLLVRRFSALRQEMAAEIEALRAGLAAFYTGVNDIADLTRLANDVQRVAAEAAAITEAVEEVDGILADPHGLTARASTLGISHQNLEAEANLRLNG